MSTQGLSSLYSPRTYLGATARFATGAVPVFAARYCYSGLPSETRAAAGLALSAYTLALSQLSNQNLAVFQPSLKKDAIVATASALGAVGLSRCQSETAKKVSCLATAVGLGYTVGRLVYRGKPEGRVSLEVNEGAY